MAAAPGGGASSGICSPVTSVRPSGPGDAAGRFNVEVKARCRGLDGMRRILADSGALPHGTDEQTDTYFEVSRGRLKVREGKIENALIAYDRPQRAGARPSAVTLAILEPGVAAAVRAALEAALPVAARVVKRREIWFDGNVKLHLDRVEGLGEFVEIEAQSEAGVPGRTALEEQTRKWCARLGLDEGDRLAPSYAEMIIGEAQDDRIATTTPPLPDDRDPAGGEPAPGSGR